MVDTSTTITLAGKGGRANEGKERFPVARRDTKMLISLHEENDANSGSYAGGKT